jgi:hypothetical protein
MSAKSTSLESLQKAIARGAQDESKAAVLPNRAADEKQQLEIDGLKTKQAGLEAEIGRLGDIHWARMIGLALLFSLIVGWLVVILLFVYWTGTPSDWSAVHTKDGDRMILKLSEPVLIALIGSTTVNVIALFVIAAKWLYGEQRKTEPKDSN